MMIRYARGPPRGSREFRAAMSSKQRDPNPNTKLPNNKRTTLQTYTEIPYV